MCSGFNADYKSSESLKTLVMLRFVMLCYAMLCYAMLCYVMLCYVMLREISLKLPESGVTVAADAAIRAMHNRLENLHHRCGTYLCLENVQSANNNLINKIIHL